MSGICREEGGKRHWHTHAGTCGDSLPWLLSAQMLSWGGAVNQCGRVCACRLLTVIWGLFSDDSCWHNAPFLYLSIQCSPSPSHLSSWPPPLAQLLIFKFHSFTRFLIFRISPDWWWEAHLLSERSSNKWVPLAYPGTFGARLLISSSSNKKKGIIKGVKWEMGEDDSLTHFN